MTKVIYSSHLKYPPKLFKQIGCKATDKSINKSIVLLRSYEGNKY